MAIEHLEGNTFTGKSLIEMQPYVLKDTSGADIHVVYMNYCGGGWAVMHGLCKKMSSIALSCHGGHQNIYGMAEITVHEIG